MRSSGRIRRGRYITSRDSGPTILMRPNRGRSLDGFGGCKDGSSVVEELVHRHFNRTGCLFQRFEGGDSMPVFDAKNMATQQTRAFFDIAQRQ